MMSNDQFRKPVSSTPLQTVQKQPPSSPPTAQTPTKPFPGQQMKSDSESAKTPAFSAPLLQRLLSLFPQDQRNNVGILGKDVYLGTIKIGEFRDGIFLIDHGLAKSSVPLLPPISTLAAEKERSFTVFFEISATQILVCAGKELGHKVFFYPLG